MLTGIKFNIFGVFLYVMLVHPWLLGNLVHPLLVHHCFEGRTGACNQLEPFEASLLATAAPGGRKHCTAAVSPFRLLDVN